jgi:rubrerythrin
MLSQNPTTVKQGRAEAVKQALRLAIGAELDAVSLYEQLAQLCDGVNKKAFLDIAKEEKTHIGEFEALLLRLDKEQAQEIQNGAREIEELSE